ncbi:hypothetical protein [Aurantiacibacter sediminis]|uniref:Uncharacterized protein n=1 Tax=Aurantiacibacter sediminis TaxID=2793064 RepID=A0ABS0N3K5_9SPHN|nr:hypothetical protein [Aurantiacibacter sediminis]MBH5322558.1 hypothetical protein [Aurantiacibacter sediminis]
MRKLTNTSVFTLTSALALTACSESSPSPEPTSSSTASSEESTFFAEEPVNVVEECLQGFSEGREVWGDNPVRSEFSYDLGGLSDEQVDAVIADLRQRDGSTQLIFNEGSSAPAASEEFLASEQRWDAEFFQAGAIRILRMRSAEALPFDDALRAGCEGAPEGATIRQVTFSQSAIEQTDDEDDNSTEGETEE